MAEIKEEIEKIKVLKNKIKDLEDLVGLAEQDEELAAQLRNEINSLSEQIRKQEIFVFLDGKYDKGGAILQIFAGAGGQDAEDWAAMLLRMYERYCRDQGYKIKILHQSFGEAGGPEGRIGIKEVSLQIKGKYAYGFLKGERGVHRLVRLSPFSAKNLRHTSFARVDVLPQISEKEFHIKIKPEDLRIDTFRASGPGGQYVNTRDTAVRITHLPSKITAASQAERQQGLNKKRAMELLYSKLYQLKEQEKEAELAKIKGKRPAAAWGNQIRSYVLHPYQLVKDLRTGVETSDVEAVLNGYLDEFIDAEIRIK